MAEYVSLAYNGRVATITLDNAAKLNAMTQDSYYKIARCLKEIDTRDDIFITVLTGKGKFFSAGADVNAARPINYQDIKAGGVEDINRHFLRTFVANNFYVTQAFYTHSKILVTALNGPAIGLSAALVAFSDFVYCTPHTFLLTPFSSLGLVAEGGASFAFVKRLGISKANEALIMSKKIAADELLACGFVNKIFETGRGEDAKFLELVYKEIDERMGTHLIGDSMLKIKALIQAPDRKAIELAGVAEVFGGLDRFAKGIPQEQFRRIASGEKRHKL